MQLPLKKEIPFVFLLLAFCYFPQAVHAEQAPLAHDVRLSPSVHPAAETLFVPSLDQAPEIAPDPAWYEQPGAAKGLRGRAGLDEELFAAPDIAVLDRGFSTSWPALFADSRQPAVLVHPSEVAGLGLTKRLLIIPTGALSNAAASAFFRAGLAEFVSGGGIVFCLSQGKGSDFSALPVPDGQRLEAAGWEEEIGPLFRASAAARHPLFAGLPGRPSMETDGYFTAWPTHAQPLLIRPDGYPTVIAYAYEKGLIITATLFTDFSLLLGSPEPEERTFIRNLLAWTKNPVIDSGPAADATARIKSPAAKKLPRKNMNISPPRVRADAERNGNQVKLSLEIPPTGSLQGQTVLLRSGGMEKTVTFSKNTTRVSIEEQVAATQQRISYALYDTDGRAIVRSSLAVPEGNSKVAPERSSCFPGETVTFNVNGMGNGEIMIGAFGCLDNNIIADRGSMNLTVPDRLPAGTYRAHWKYRTIKGDERHGNMYIDLAGYRIAVRNMMFDKKSGRSRATVSFTFDADVPVSGHLRLMLRGPDGRTTVAAEPVLSLTEGVQTVPVSFSFKPDMDGIWELLYSFRSALSPGDGIPEGPVDLSSGSMLFDAGQSAVLAVITEKPFYYEPSGPVSITAILAGQSRAARLDVNLNGTKISRETIDLAGTMRYRTLLPRPGPGIHTVRVSLAPAGSAVKTFRYGLNLPDLAVTILTGEPAAGSGGPELPVTAIVRNSGKSRAARSRVSLSEGTDGSGETAASLDIPELAPGEQREVSFAWPLAEKAGLRALTATADADNGVVESNELNNRSSAAVTVPDVLLLPGTVNPAFNAADPVAVDMSVFNLTSRIQKGLVLNTKVQGPDGNTISTIKTSIARIEPGPAKTMQLPVKMTAPSAGQYLVLGRWSKDRKHDAVLARFRIKPTLLLSGSFEKTADTAVLCRPFTVHFSVTNAGNVVPSSGTIRLEIVSPGEGGKTIYGKEFPFSAGKKSFSIGSFDQRPGVYLLRLTASVSNDQHAMSGKFVLAERQLKVAGPVMIQRDNPYFPRVLVWMGNQGRKVEQALSESIINQAFERENLYYKVVDSEDKFFGSAMTGIFNTFVLVEPRQMPGADLLKERVERGDGVVIVGSGEFSRALAEKFEFSLEEFSAEKPPSLVTFNEDIGLAGTMPVAGKAFSPAKKGSKSIAFFSPSGRPAALLDEVGRGRLVVMPVSLSSSAYRGGASWLYSLVLRRIALFAAPKSGVPDGAVSGGFLFSSAKGPVKAVITKKLAAGDRVLWTNAGGVVDQNSLSYTLTADREPRALLYLYQPSDDAADRVEEVFFECDGKYVSQGKAE